MNREQIIDFVWSYFDVGVFNPRPQITPENVVTCIERLLECEHTKQLDMIVSGGRYEGRYE